MVEASFVVVLVTLVFLVLFTVASVHYMKDVLTPEDEDHGPGGQPS
ncbi:hypothetical protein ACKVMT_01755 [Halobacteriales archaeon Cl-PHB]